MSIREEWLRHVRAKRLHKLESIILDDPKGRTVLMSEQINALVSGPWTDDAMGRRCGVLRGRLERIARGGPLIVCMKPFKARKAEIGRLDEVEDSVFDIRDSEKPGLRIFFMFVERDVLVAFACAPRSVTVPWLNRLPLGDRYSREWRWGVQTAQTQWSQLFPRHDPVKGDNLDDYLSNAFSE